MAAAAIPLMVAGGVMQAVGAIREGQAADAAAKYNAAQAERQAGEARAQGMEEARRARIQGKKQLGDIRANYGASGVSLEGSALDVLEESAANAELDALTVQHAGESRAYAFESDARLSRFQGKNAKIAGYTSAASSLLMSGGKAAGGAGAG